MQRMVLPQNLWIYGKKIPPLNIDLESHLLTFSILRKKKIKRTGIKTVNHPQQQEGLIHKKKR